jgi:hypothetical protein
MTGVCPLLTPELLLVTDYFKETRSYWFMVEEWAEERDKAVLNTVYYCETCNVVIEPGDADISIHKKELPHHKMRRVMLLRCSRCGNVVTDSYAQYSPEKNQFWCKDCISEAWR